MESVRSIHRAGRDAPVWASILLLGSSMRFLKSWKVPFICAFSADQPAAGADHHLPDGGRPRPGESAAPPVARAVPNVPAGAVEVSLSDALGRHWLEAQYVGNGHSEIKATVANRYNKPLRLTFDSGLIFETADLRQQMVVARAQLLDLPAGSTRATWLACAATRSANALASQPYRLCPDTLQALTPLFAQVDQSPEISREAIQTAVLLLTENAPLRTVRQVQPAVGRQRARAGRHDGLPSEHRRNPRGVQLLKDAGYSRMNLVAAQEPQLKIEAMIDPLAHAAAAHYFNLSHEQEWAYWRDELSKGDLSTRHYALYGIGRYYPDVALQMLPDWARAAQLSSLMRTSAIQAMAETHRPEAISVLQQLVSEFGAATELGQSARKAMAFLENQRAAPVTNNVVDFKLSQASLR